MMNYNHSFQMTLQREDIVRQAAREDLNAAKDALAQIREKKEKTERTHNSFVQTLKRLEVDYHKAEENVHRVSESMREVQEYISEKAYDLQQIHRQQQEALRRAEEAQTRYDSLRSSNLPPTHPHTVTMATPTACSGPNVGYSIISARMEKIKQVEKCETRQMLRKTFPRKEDIYNFVRKLFQEGIAANTEYPFPMNQKVKYSHLQKPLLYKLVEDILKITD